MVLRSIVRRLAWTLAIVGLLAGAGYLFRAPLLTGLAEAWVVNDPVAKADAIVILGGWPELRPAEAARLFHQGYAPRILCTDVKLSPAAEMGIALSERELTRRVLLSNNVPETAIIVVGKSVANTYEESLAVRTWVEATKAKSIIIVTDLAHSRRARWIFRKELKGTGAQIQMHAVKPKQYGITDWWRHEDGVRASQDEFVKYLYYRLKY